MLRTEYCGCTDYIIKIKCFEKKSPNQCIPNFQDSHLDDLEDNSNFSPWKSFSSLGLVKDCGFDNPQLNWFLFLFEKLRNFCELS